MSLNKFTDREAIAVAEQIRDKLPPMGITIAQTYFHDQDALARVINLALETIDNKEKKRNE